MKIVLHSRVGALVTRHLQGLAGQGLHVAVVAETDKAGLTREIADAEVLLHVLEPVTAEMIAAAPKLRLIQKIGVGVNTIDRAAAAGRGVAVANMPGTNTQAVAEHTIALILAVLRRFVELDRATRADAGWALPMSTLERFGELSGRTVGLIGLGAVPQRVVPILETFGADWLCHSLDVPERFEHKAYALREVFERSDIVSLHVPLTEETKGMVNAESLAWMRPGAILINTARGELVDEPALARALSTDALRGAGLDVFGCEPVDAGNPLLALPNVVVTPHLAWLTPETLERSLAVAVENCRRLADGEALMHVVPWTA